MARLRTSGTLDLGDPEVCHNLVGQVDQADREDRDRLEDHGLHQVPVVAKDGSPATECEASVRCRSSLLLVTGRVTGSGG